MKSIRKIIFALFIISIFQYSFAQERQGNIVEYFGKEKVENINEGKIAHIFKEGLILRSSNIRGLSGTLPTNSLFAEILQNGTSNFSAGSSQGLDLMNRELVWEKIQVSDNNEFQDRKIQRSGYLYLEYTSESEEILLFEASGHTDVLINGFPYEGDHYDYGWSLIPIKILKGKNEFVLRGGRFPRIRARLLKPNNLIQFTIRDMTLPDILIEENQNLLGAIRVINSSNLSFIGGSISCKVGDAKIDFPIPSISAMAIRKVPFSIAIPTELTDKKNIEAILQLRNKVGEILSTETIELRIKSKFKHHKRTFISKIDGSVQYYSIAPSTNPNIENPAMFLSVHGASVEAVNQARAYKQKDWGHLVAPTNRRPFGYAWEEWGRIDAMEVLNNAEKLLKTDPNRTYLTGHSMGGHGTWQLGVTYPDRFAAIAPCAGYPDLLNYSNSFLKRIKTMSADRIKRWGFDKDELIKALKNTELTKKNEIEIDSMMRRSGNPGRTLKLKRNYLHHGIFILHGEKDNVVPTEQARKMRAILGQYHNDFTYYEYPDGKHWYGDHSVDWPPIFDFFKARTLMKSNELKKYEFYTASPGVSSGSHFINILQQKVPLEISSFVFNKEKESTLTIRNASLISIDQNKMGGMGDTILIDNQEMILSMENEIVYLKQVNEKWQTSVAPSLNEKGPHRNGGFKDSFNNNVVLVYATNGTDEENRWYFNRAKYDAQKFEYIGNGSIEIITDKEFSNASYIDRNVVLYGNKNNNVAWNTLLRDCPIQVSNNQLQIGDKILKGEKWGSYFIYPRYDSDIASVGVVTATGTGGMKAAFANDYVGRTAYPDVIIFDETMMKDGIKGIKCCGFFGNDWSIENGDIRLK